jgi:hypothetical protein
MLSLTAMLELNVKWVISRLDVAATLCGTIPGTYVERSEQTGKKCKEIKQINIEFSVFIVT